MSELAPLVPPARLNNNWRTLIIARITGTHGSLAHHFSDLIELPDPYQ